MRLKVKGEVNGLVQLLKQYYLMKSIQEIPYFKRHIQMKAIKDIGIMENFKSI